jgi:hypothetical protein
LYCYEWYKLSRGLEDRVVFEAKGKKVHGDLKWWARCLVTVIILIYVFLVSANYCEAPLASEMSKMKTSTMDLLQEIGVARNANGKIISRVEPHVKGLKNLENCSTAACREEAKEILRPFEEYHIEMIQRMVEKNPEDQKLAELLELKKQSYAITMSYDPIREGHKNISGDFVQYLAHQAYRFLPEEKRENIDLKSLTYNDIKNIYEIAQWEDEILRDAEEHTYDLLEREENIALLIGINKIVDSWRQQMESWGFIRDISIFFIVALGPGISGQLALVGFIVKDYIDQAYTKEVENGVIMFVKNDVTLFHFAIKFLLGGGLIYIPHLIKILLLKTIGSHSSFFRGFTTHALNKLRHFCEQQKPSKEDTIVYHVTTFLIVFFQVFEEMTGIIVGTIIHLNVFGQVLSILVELAGVTIKEDWILTSTAKFENDIRFFVITHIIPHAWKFFGQFAVLLVFYYIHSTYKKHNANVKLPGKQSRFIQLKKNPNTNDPEIKREWAVYRRWDILNKILRVFWWSQPFLGLARYIFPSWFDSLDFIGYLNFEQGGANYFWSLLDLYTLPSFQMRATMLAQ